MDGLIEGRMVHNYSNGRRFAAVISEVVDKERGLCQLTVFLPGAGISSLGPTPYSTERVDGTWGWMERA